MSKYDIALFDLDGTLSQSALGIKICMKKTLDRMGKPYPDLSDYSKYIGPPLALTFQRLCGLSAEESLEAVRIYVEIYDEIGVEYNELFPGVVQMLKKLRENSVRLAICSSKHESVAREVVDSLGILQYFDAVCGSTLDGSRKEKEDLIPYALESLSAKENERAVMIGDTGYDAKGALACKVDFIGVTYGYGTVDSMKQHGGTMFASDVPQILQFF